MLLKAEELLSVLKDLPTTNALIVFNNQNLIFFHELTSDKMYVLSSFTKANSVGKVVLANVNVDESEFLNEDKVEVSINYPFFIIRFPTSGKEIRYISKDVAYIGILPFSSTPSGGLPPQGGTPP